ncbi:MAG: hypothetical protein NC388_04675, partial [Clostridium sp.]|nr:hypothetical protein [Clostridium sp.]
MIYIKKNVSNTTFRLISLLYIEKCVPLHRVFHSIRFKVNKGWASAEALFLCPVVRKAVISGHSRKYIVFQDIHAILQIGKTGTSRKVGAYVKKQIVEEL